MNFVKIYLSSFGKNDEWAHVLVRDITTLRDYWSNQFQSNSHLLYVIHVGFERPEYLLEDLLEFSKNMSQPLFLTEAAKWVLPFNLGISHSDPVSSCRIGHSDRKCPVYFSVKGWGYEVTDIENVCPKPVSSSLEGFNAETKLSDWIRDLTNKLPQVAKVLFDNGIFTDEQYRVKANALEKNHRSKVDNFRFAHLSQDVHTRRRPFQLLKIAPEWLLSSSIHELFVSQRLQNIFAIEKIEFVKDLLRYSEDSFLKLKNCGSKSILDLHNSILDAINRGQLISDLGTESSHFDKWIKDLHSELPEVFQIISNLGINSDNGYIEIRKNLEESDRRAIDNFRFFQLESLIEKNDPFALLTIVPDWILSLNIQSIYPTARLANVFNRISVVKVRDLASHSKESLLSLDNFGSKSLRDLAKCISDTCKKNTHEDRFDSSSTIPLIQLLTNTINELPERPREILKARLCYNGTRLLTLQELGEIFGITRERIRQIEKKYFTIIENAENWDDVLRMKLRSLLKDRSEPLFLNILGAEDPWFDGFSDRPNFLSSVISRFTQGTVFVLRIDNIYVLSKISQESFESLINQVKDLLEKSVSLNLRKEELEDRILGVCVEYGCSDLFSLVKSLLSDTIHFVIDEHGNQIFNGIGRSAEQYAMTILSDAERPLHYSEVWEKMKTIKNENVDVRRVHNALAQHPGIFLFNRGTYGIKRHLRFTDEQISEIKSAAEDLIQSGNEYKQWHLAELVELIHEGIDFKYAIDKYSLGIILSDSEYLVSLGRQVYVSKYHDQLSTNDRIRIEDAMISILEKEGGPMNLEGLKAKVSQHRGLKPNSPILPGKNLIKIKPSVWGLRHRDIGLNDSELEAGLNIILKFIFDHVHSIHFSELPDLFSRSTLVLPKDFNTYVFLSLCGTDDRFRVWPGGLIGHSSWKNSRRHSFASAFREVLSSLSGPHDINSIYEQVSHLLGRSVPKIRISNALSTRGIPYDREKGVWTIVSGDKNISHPQEYMEDEFDRV